jgi:hypothetical protein
MHYAGRKTESTEGHGMGLILEKETYAIRGAVFDVYKEMGSGFLEPVYHECMEKELRTKGIPYCI